MSCSLIVIQGNGLSFCHKLTNKQSWNYDYETWEWAIEIERVKMIGSIGGGGSCEC